MPCAALPRSAGATACPGLGPRIDPVAGRDDPASAGCPAPETAATYRAKIERDLVEIERNEMRPSAYAFEGWALLDDLDYVRDVIRRLRADGIRAVLYHRAYVSDDALNTQPKGDFEETAAGARGQDGGRRALLFGGNGDSPATLLDFTNPRTVRWWRRRLELSLDLGASGFMQDFGEQVQEGMRFADGSTGRTMHNRYPVLFHRISRRLVDDYARRKGLDEPIWFFTRSGYSGRPGSAASEMSNFPGDETTDWSAGSGLRSLAPDMLNRAAGGAFGFSTDIGGYIDFTDGPPDAELFTRWSEWAALTPYFRVHNSAVNGTRMPWSYGGPTLSRWKALAALHQRAVPYMRRLALRPAHRHARDPTPVAGLPPRPPRAPSGPAVDARPRRARGAGGGGGSDVAAGLSAARLLAAEGRGTPPVRAALRHGGGAAGLAALLRAGRRQTVLTRPARTIACSRKGVRPRGELSRDAPLPAHSSSPVVRSRARDGHAGRRPRGAAHARWGPQPGAPTEPQDEQDQTAQPPASDETAGEAPASSGGTLPYTGLETLWIALAGIALLLAGGACGWSAASGRWPVAR